MSPSPRKWIGWRAWIGLRRGTDRGLAPAASHGMGFAAEGFSARRLPRRAPRQDQAGCARRLRSLARLRRWPLDKRAALSRSLHEASPPLRRRAAMPLPCPPVWLSPARASRRRLGRAVESGHSLDWEPLVEAAAACLQRAEPAARRRAAATAEPGAFLSGESCHPPG